MVESKRGEYVEVKEAEKLEQLNKEMLEMLKLAGNRIKELTATEYDRLYSMPLLGRLQLIIAKAEETA